MKSGSSVSWEDRYDEIDRLDYILIMMLVG